jgi:hypothetical protein
MCMQEAFLMLLQAIVSTPAAVAPAADVAAALAADVAVAVCVT